MRIRDRVITVMALLSVGAGAALASDSAPKGLPFYEVQRVLDDGRMVISYKGGTYIGYTYAVPDADAPVWHGRCAFHFKTGGVFEGTCAYGKFRRGYLRSVDGRSVHFLDTGRSQAEALRSVGDESAL